MAVTSGFFNSVGGDRKYDAIQMSQLFEGIIRDGVFMSVGQAFFVSASSGNNVVVGTGRAWFNNTWTNNDSSLTIAMPNAHSTLNRRDAVVLEVNWAEGVRENSIKAIQGTAAASPVNPAMGNTGTMRQYPLAYIYRPGGSGSISAENITFAVGSPATPFVSGPLATLTIENWTAQMEDQWDTWINGLIEMLDEDAEANIAVAISDIQTRLNGIDTSIQNHGASLVQVNNGLTAVNQALVTEQNARVAKDNNLQAQITAITGTSDQRYMRMNTFRGKNLGDRLKASDLVKIRNGGFEDMWLGDYWLANGTVYRIVDFNYLFNSGVGHPNNVANKPHIVVMPDTIPITTRFHATATDTSGGYNGSPAQLDVSTAFVARFASDLKVTASEVFPLFGEYVTNGLSGSSQTTILANARAIIPTYLQIYGVTPCADDLNSYGQQQFALFRNHRSHIRSAAGNDYWLRSIQGSTSYFYVNSNGYRNARGANVLTRARPYFLVA